jgi:cyclic-di-GMP-binding protein
MDTQVMAVNTAQVQFTNGASCMQWLEALPLTNAQSAQSALTQQIALVCQAGIPPLDLLDTLEALREPVAYVQNEVARKYTAKPLPLEALEAALWTKTQALWQELINGYLLCRAAYVKGDPGLRNHGALIVMRCLRYLSSAMFDYCRVYRQTPAELWKKLHEQYGFAEQSGFALAAVAEGSGPQETVSNCTTAYCQALLIQLANPSALSGRQMDFLARWVEKWSGLVGLAPLPLPPSSIPPLAVDLAGSAGPAFAEGLAPLASLRYLDLDQLGRALRQLITLLKQGQTPAQIGLGEDARQPGCENLLMLLYIQWCRAGTGRSEQRNPSAEKAQVCLGMHAAHFYISGRAFRAPGSGPTRQEQNDMQMFGHVSERTQQALASAVSSAVESWLLLNQSGSGFMCMLREPDAQLRIGHNQLVAVRRGSDKIFYLGVVQWLRVEENTELYAGVRLFPGSARAVAVRPANFNPSVGIKGFERGLWLPALPPSTPATLILPAGWYQAGRVVEIHGDQKQNAKLVSLLEKGSDFDRCTVAPA